MCTRTTRTLQNRAACANRRLIALLLLCCFVLGSLAGCSGKQAEPQPGVTYTQAMDAMNRQVAAGLSDEMPDITWWGAVGDGITVCGRGPQAAGGDRPWLMADVDPEGESYASMALTLPPVEDGLPGIRAALEEPDTARDLAAGYDIAYRDIAAVLQDSTGQLLLLLEDTLLHYGEDAHGAAQVEVTERAVTLCSLAADGALQPAVRLQIPEEYLYLTDIAADCLLLTDSCLWLAAANVTGGQAALLRFSLPDGSLHTALPLPDGQTLAAGCLAQLTSGRLLVLTAPTGDAVPGTALRGCQLVESPAGDAPAWAAQPPALPQALAQAYTLALLPQSGPVDSPLLRSDEGISQWNLVQGTVSEELTWAGYGIDRMALAAVFAIAGGRYLTVLQPQDGSACQLRILTRLDPAALAGRTVITFAKQTHSMLPVGDCIQDVIDKFNANSTQYYVQVVDYTVPGGSLGTDQITAVQKKLMQDIVSGNMPDVVMLSSVSMASYVGSATACLLNKDIFVDLYPLLDADPELSRQDFLPSILQCTEKDGTLPTVVPAFTVHTAAAGSRDVPAGTGLTMEDYNALRAVDPTPFLNTSWDEVLQNMIQCAGSQFVDWGAHQAHFDTPAFAALLEATAAQPDWRDLQDCVDMRSPWQAGVPVMLDLIIDSWSALGKPQYLFDQDWTLTGFPSDQAAGRGSAIAPRLRLGISATCENVGGAWEFLRMFLLPEFQNKLGEEAGYEGFPLRQDSLQRAAHPRNVSGYYALLDGNPDPGAVVELTLTQQTIDRFMALVEELDALWNTEPDLFTIVEEEAAYYYSGTRTAAEAAAIIQDRVQKYLDEQA